VQAGGSPQEVEAAGYVQLSDVPLQRPPQTVSEALVHAGRPATGWPEVTLVQVPAVLLQVWHCPGQGVSQQTPSGEQFPDKHSPPTVHVFPVPLAFLLAQTPDEGQYCPFGQEIDVHEPAQVTPSHRPVGHGDALWNAQAPLLLQYEAGMCPLAEQLSFWQILSVGILHAVALEPSHSPWHTPVPGQAVRLPRGAPEVTVLHVPTLPFSAQAWHCLEHRSLQQTLSTQKPRVQS
jgi:hypothetical protein